MPTKVAARVLSAADDMDEVPGVSYLDDFAAPGTGNARELAQHIASVAAIVVQAARDCGVR
eukprot:2158699-Lingulodinium_polyedra.AAC.1